MQFGLTDYSDYSTIANAMLNKIRGLHSRSFAINGSL